MSISFGFWGDNINKIDKLSLWQFTQSDEYSLKTKCDESFGWRCILRFVFS
ncbi:Uncharacterised protein [Moraxella veridica]|uniref:Uncharacterized protein n=1 Tax=Moraxella catarrhalis TaxID=480 RepID=A0A7Z0UWG3_MORCA|nr:hypothetical protein AO382_2240 [Moraxella catarrhalis]STY82424.1 Uncharacterised protein [Moraxella catarrhalis]